MITRSKGSSIVNNPGFKRLAVRTLLIGIPCSLLGFFLVMMWGLSAQAGHTNVLLRIAGVVGYVPLLPTMLLGYAAEASGGFGVEVETVLMIVAQFVGYFALICASHITYVFMQRRQRT